MSEKDVTTTDVDGWRATVNGEPAEMFLKDGKPTVNLNFRPVPLERMGRTSALEARNRCEPRNVDVEIGRRAREQELKEPRLNPPLTEDELQANKLWIVFVTPNEKDPLYHTSVLGD